MELVEIGPGGPSAHNPMDFDPYRTPTTPRDAASVILLRARPTDGSAEIFLLRRHRGASFMAEAFVFPGGAREGDEDLSATAARELLEEAGVRIDPASLVLFAHWITPSAREKRFSARFFVAELPAGQTPRFDGAETVDELWATLAEALARSIELRLPPPQIRTLFDLRELAARGPAAVLGFARGRAARVRPIMPRMALIEGDVGGLAVLLPWDPDYESRGLGEGEPFAADDAFATGPTRFVLAGVEGGLSWKGAG